MNDSKTIEELDKLINLFREFDGDKKAEFIERYPEIWNGCFDISEQSRYHEVMINCLIAGIRAAESHYQYKVDKLLQIVEMQREALNEVNTDNFVYDDYCTDIGERVDATITKTDKMLKELNQNKGEENGNNNSRG